MWTEAIVNLLPAAKCYICIVRNNFIQTEKQVFPVVNKMAGSFKGFCKVS